MEVRDQGAAASQPPIKLYGGLETAAPCSLTNLSLCDKCGGLGGKFKLQSAVLNFDRLVV